MFVPCGGIRSVNGDITHSNGRNRRKDEID